MFKCDVRAKGDRVYLGEVQGNGGPCRSARRVRQILRERLKDELARIVEEQNGGPPRGWAPRRAYLDDLIVWTDPDNPDPSLRGTKLKASEVQEIRHQGQIIWPLDRS